MTPASPWWRPAVHADRRPFLQARGRIVAALRRSFDEQGFTEFEAAALQVSPGNETHLHAFATELIEADGSRTPLYLHTSPEFAAKKLLAAGETRIFDFARVFRNRERSALHHPEFTLLEWYRAHETYERLMEDCARVLAVAAEAAGAAEFRYRGKAADPFAVPERLSVAEAFGRYAGIDLMETLSAETSEAEALPSPGRGDPAKPVPGRLAAEARRLDIRVAHDDTWSDIFSRILTQRIEPNLGMGRARSSSTIRRARRRWRGASRATEAGGAFRALRLRRRARQCLWRADRPGRAAAALRGRHGGQDAHLWRAVSDR
jgi:lysyl-tRNA synthetase class 2